MTSALLITNEDRIRRAESIARWRIRKLLAALPPRPQGVERGVGSPARIAYLFSGTYGDFVQILPSLRRLAAAYPKADLVLVGGKTYAREFNTEVPRILRLAESHEPWTWAFSRADMLFTNAVGVFRGTFDLAARLCARRAFGFRHAEEAGRGGYTRTLRLDEEVSSFAEENLKLLDLALVPDAWGVGPGPGTGRLPYADGAVSAQPVDPWGRGRILFHVGSAGLKRELGLAAYAGIITDILGQLEDRKVELLMGPGDEDIIAQVNLTSRIPAQSHPIPKLIRQLRAFEGTIVCFNSFMAHLCHYLGKPAIVLHARAVPYGYDCSVIHRQVVLRPENSWGVGEVLQAIGMPEHTFKSHIA